MAQNFLYDSGPTWSIRDGAQDYVNEQNLFTSMVVEANDIFGFEIDYYVLEIEATETLDRIYGENQNEYYSGPFRSRITYTPTEEPNLIDAFGITAIEEISFMHMPKYTFTRDISAAIDPKVGDVVYTIWNDRTYQITDVGEEGDMFLGTKPVWQFITKPYKLTLALPAIADSLTDALPLSAWGDNAQIEEDSTLIDDYSDLPDLDELYGFS